MSYINDYKKFWKTHLSNKNINGNKIILVEDEEIIINDKDNAEIFNDYFIALQKLNIQDMCEVGVALTLSTIDNIIYTYRKHPSIIKIKVIALTTEYFSFGKMLPGQLEKEITDLNPKKANLIDSLFHVGCV